MENSAVNKPIDLATLFARAWDIFQSDLSLYLGIALLALLLRFLAQGAALVFLLIFLFPITDGMYVVALRRTLGKPSSFRDAMAFVQRLGSIIGVKLILFGITTGVSLIVSILVMRFALGVPGFLTVFIGALLSGLYLFAIPVILDQSRRAWAAMEASRHLVTPRLLFVLSFVLIKTFVDFIGSMLPYGIGLLFTIPFSACLVIALYEHMAGVQGHLPSLDHAPANDVSA